jgi:hypothetical protein
VRPIPHRHHAAGKAKIRRRLDRPLTAPSPEPVLTAANIHYEAAARARAIACGGIGAAPFNSLFGKSPSPQGGPSQPSSDSQDHGGSDRCWAPGSSARRYAVCYLVNVTGAPHRTRLGLTRQPVEG